MAQLELQPAATKGSKRRLPASLRIDMTPMVDLGFLLITFFIFTTTMSQPRATSLIMPADGTPIPVKQSNSLTVLLSNNNKVFAYEGEWKEAVKNNKVVETNYNVYDGIGKLIRAKQEKLAGNGKEGRDDLVFIIKAASGSSYNNVIDALDETIINEVKKYAVVNMTDEEEIFLKDK